MNKLLNCAKFLFNEAKHEKKEPLITHYNNKKRSTWTKMNKVKFSKTSYLFSLNPLFLKTRNISPSQCTHFYSIVLDS